MALLVDGYRMERLLRSAGVGQVWAALRERDQLPVIAKSFVVEGQPDLEARVEHEFELIRRLDCPGVIRALALERSGTALVLVLEAHRGVNLREYCDGRPLAIDEFLEIAGAIAAILAEVHQRRVVHRDLKPTNILIDPQTRAIALADFGISALLESERGRIHERSVIEGTLPYMAPEQTGRTGREVDTRTDLYALGVTFYELVTGRRPFEADSPLELIHAHFARRPVSPQRLRPELPNAIAELILKLLEKAPERRYQSARGLSADLQRLRRDGCHEEFELGQADASATLQMPHQLYGRAQEREQIEAAFARAAAGQPQFVVVVGPSGIGKSALLDVVVEPVLAHSGLLGRGKCEDESARPYSGLTAALEAIVDQLLTESSEQLASWGERLREVLGGFAGPICELVPRLRALLGEVEASPALPPAEARNQTTVAFSRLLSAFARREHPLVLALDDIQWIDGASVELLDRLLGEADRALLLLATAREQALEPGSHLRALLHRLEQRGLEPLSLALAPIDQAALTQMLGDMLSRSGEDVAPLAQVVARKTGNNPFFARQFLLLLGELGLLERGPEGWRWDLRAIEQAALPEDALEMMTAKLDRLAPELRELICVASVCGSQFEPAIVEQVLAGPSAMAGFQRLIEEGLLSPVAGHGLLFAHDRIREAAYALLGPTRQRELHLEIGEQLRERDAGSGRRVFEIADHLDRGHGLLEPDAADVALAQPRRELLAELNLQAARRALHGGAPEAAQTYLEVAARLLAEQPFPARGHPRRALHFDVALARAEVQATLAPDGPVDPMFLALLERELEPEELGRVAVARVWYLIRRNQRGPAFYWGLEVLRQLGVKLPRKPGSLHAALALPKLVRTLRAAESEQLQPRAPLRDARVLATLDLMMLLNGTAFLVAPPTFVVLVERHIGLLAQHGQHPSEPHTLTQIGMILAGALGWHTRAVELARRCLAAVDRGPPNPYRYRLLLTVAWTGMWSDNLHEVVETSAAAVEGAMEAGDVEVAASGWTLRVEPSLWAGVHLRSLEELAEAQGRWFERWAMRRVGINLELGGVCRQLIAGPLPEPGALERRWTTRTEPEDKSDLWGELGGVLLHAFVLVVLARYDEVRTTVLACGRALEREIPGSWHSTMIHTLIGVTQSELAFTGPDPRARRRARALLRRAFTTLAKRRSDGANLTHAVELLAGELAGLDGDLAGASQAFERAREHAQAQRNPMFEALISERAARVCLHLGAKRLARAPLADARAAYQRWGAFAKVAQLDAQFPELALEAGAGGRADDSSSSRTSSSSTTSKALDHATLLEASQAIAEDIVLDEVVARVLQLASENAGAERGALLLRRDGELALAAEFELETNTTRVLEQALPLAKIGDRVPVQVLRFVLRSQTSVVLGDAGHDLRFAGDPYLSGAPRSLLCTPIIKHGAVIGLIYLENRLSRDSFTAERLETLRLLAAQAGSAIENAQLYDELRVSEIRWRSLVEQLPDYVALLRRGGEIELANATAGRPRFDFEQHREALAPALAELFDSGQRVDLELGDDSQCFVVRMAPVVFDSTITRAIVVATDVSERRKAQRERARLEAQLRQQQRLESIGTLASGVAHEINNPVQGIMNYAELIARSPAADEDVREFAGEIVHETNRVASIVRNLLAFSRQEREEPIQATSVREIVDGTLSLLRAVLRKDQIALRVELDDGLPQLRCRPQQIQQVLLNLVTNARDALNARFPRYDERKRISIGAEPFTREGASWVRVVVEDQGGGVPEHAVDRIFDPFFTTKGRDQGTGLGLAVSHGIVADHGGELRLDNRPGEGARFCIELPSPA